MTFDYLSAFPIPVEVMPERLRILLSPVSEVPDQFVEVAARLELHQYSDNAENLHLQMAVVPGVDGGPIEVMSEAGGGVVEFSVPAGDAFGCSEKLSPSLSGYDYIVAAWGSGSFFSFSLAEKVWMALGLSARCVCNEHQRLVFDDLKIPVFDVAHGEVSTDYFWKLKRDVSWKMSNEYLRRYLWLRGARAVRVFFYEARLPDSRELRNLMDGKPHVVLKPEDGVAWYELDIREHENRLLIQVWASVEAVMPEPCAEQSADGIVWPGIDEPMTYDQANALVGRQHPVYLNDKFLQKYEQNSFYDSQPVRYGAAWLCSPSYQGQWAFSECRRVGRNLVVVPMRELYKPKPDREIVHARKFAIDPGIIPGLNLDEEHIVSKVHRLSEVLMRLGDNLSGLARAVERFQPATEITGFNRAEIAANGWLHYPELSRLAQVAPLDMTQQDFLARCKSIHELWQRIPNGFLKALLVRAGCPNEAVRSLGSLKLLQALLNIVQNLNRQGELKEAFDNAELLPNWTDANESMAPLFLNHQLRIADAHDAIGECLLSLQRLGFDTASLNNGYGRALDFIFDGVIDAFTLLANEIESLLNRN
jgi:hypothetical protein